MAEQNENRYRCGRLTVHPKQKDSNGAMSDNTNWIQNRFSWAYMKMLREGNKTRKVYDINPYVEVYKFSDNMYGLFNQNLRRCWRRVAVSHHRAGKGDAHRYRFRSWRTRKVSLIRFTGGMPLIVVNTHLGPRSCRWETSCMTRCTATSMRWRTSKPVSSPAHGIPFDKTATTSGSQFDMKGSAEV